jgi:type 1 glutamine amidotransferase
MRAAALLAAALLLVAAQDAPDPHRPAPVVDTAAPPIPAAIKQGGVLVFSKTNGWRHVEHLPHSGPLIAQIAAGKCTPVFSTENAAVFNPADLKRFSVVVLNSNSGDAFSPSQRQAFAEWIQAGGGVVALHAAGGDPSYAWKFYVDRIIGAQFIGHPGGEDHFQPGRITIDRPDHPVMAGVTLPWTPTDEWYSFASAPGTASTVLASLDEGSYRPGAKLAMGKHHPIVWTHELGKGRIVYSAIGHTPEAYDDPNNRRLIANAIGWVRRGKPPACGRG